jgi:alpha-beta hydrolase superfamily lysophospholipase
VVHRLVQDAFEPLPKRSAHTTEPLVIHKHASAPETTQNIIFVHGLNGQRYSTWGKFPSLIFEDYPSVDVALYDYASGVRRVRRGSLNLRDHATLLAEVMREEDYAQTVLVGHSMGGLLCMAAVQKMIDSEFRTKDGTSAVDRIAGVFLMATPLAGSLRVIPPFGLFSDGRILRAHSSFTREINSCFTNKLVINCTGRGPIDRRHCVPTYAVVGLRDKWVDGYSSGVSIPANQMKHVPRTHTGVTKPSGREDDVYNWVRLRISDCLNHIAQCPGKSQRPGAQEAGAQLLEIPGDAYDRVMKSLPDDLKMIIKRQDWGS